MRDFPISDRRLLSDARGARSLVLLAGSPEQLAPLVRALDERRAELEAEQAGVISAAADPNARRALEQQNDGPLALPVVIITDRYGEIAQVWQGELPGADAVLRMLEYVTIRCEECFPPEWPPV